MAINPSLPLYRRGSKPITYPPRVRKGQTPFYFTMGDHLLVDIQGELFYNLPCKNKHLLLSMALVV